MTDTAPPSENRPALSDFTIGAFRGLKDLTLKGMGRINLLVGPNNCGKTSVLEAMAVFCDPMNVFGWLSVALRRSVLMHKGLKSYSDTIFWLFPLDEYSTERYFELGAKSGDDDIALSVFLQTRLSLSLSDKSVVNLLTGNAQDDGASYVKNTYDLDISFSRSGVDKFAHLELWDKAECESEELFSASYHPPYLHRSVPDDIKNLSTLLASNKMQALNELLSDLDPKISGLELLAPDGDKPLMVIRLQTGEVLPISVFGDGIRRAISLALAAYQARGGLLLIDEIEAALHVSALQQFFPWLVRVCETLNVQIVATTHSLEAIGALCALDDEHHFGLTAYHIEEQGKSVKRYSADMLQRMVYERGLDIR